MTDGELLEALRERLLYVPEEGALYRRAGYTGVKEGDRLGCPDSAGALQATFLGTRYQVAWLVWILETGSLPGDGLSRINGNSGDDRFCNLTTAIATWSDSTREAKQAQHQAAFLSNARSRFGHLEHDLSSVQYVDADTAVAIGCPIHGGFKRAPGSYLPSALGCPTCCQEASLAASRKTPEERAATARAYQQLHKVKISAAVLRHYHRTKHEPARRAARVCRQMVARVLRETKRGRAGPTSLVLGYSFETFRGHIAGQFEPWMTWDNHGEWHVDHIKSVAEFLNEGMTDPAVINALSNLRPLSAGANLRRSKTFLNRAARPLSG